MLYIKMLFAHIFTTILFAYQQPYSKDWDKLLREIVEDGVMHELDEHTVWFSLGGRNYEIWVANKWYAYGYLWHFNDVSRKHDQHTRKVPGALTARSGFYSRYLLEKSIRNIQHRRNEDAIREVYRRVK